MTWRTKRRSATEWRHSFGAAAPVHAIGLHSDVIRVVQSIRDLANRPQCVFVQGPPGSGLTHFCSATQAYFGDDPGGVVFVHPMLPPDRALARIEQAGANAILVVDDADTLQPAIRARVLGGLSTRSAFLVGHEGLGALPSGALVCSIPAWPVRGDDVLYLLHEFAERLGFDFLSALDREPDERVANALKGHAWRRGAHSIEVFADALIRSLELAGHLQQGTAFAASIPLIAIQEAFVAVGQDAESSPRVSEREWMKLAVQEARRSVAEDGKPRPKVGAVVVRNGRLVGAAHRGECAVGAHAEFGLLEGKLTLEALAGAALYATLEPCTVRNPPKRPCAEWIVDRKIARVVVGMLDPDDRIQGDGVQRLRAAGIEVGFFDSDLMTELEELNREFTQDRKRQRVAVDSAAALAAGNVAPQWRKLAIALLILCALLVAMHVFSLLPARVTPSP